MKYSFHLQVGIERGQNNQPLLRAELDVRPKQDGRVLDRPAAISIGPEEVYAFN